MPEAEAGQNRHVNFRRHQRAPGERPALFDAADDEGQRRGKNDLDPGVQAARAHGPRSAHVNRRDIAHAVIRRDRTDQSVPMTTTNCIAISVWPNQSSASGTQQTLGNVCSPRPSTPIVSCAHWNRAVSKPSGTPDDHSEKVAEQQPLHRHPKRFENRPIFAPNSPDSARQRAATAPAPPTSASLPPCAREENARPPRAPRKKSRP